MPNEITKEITRIFERRNEVLMLACFTDLRLANRFLDRTKTFEEQIFSLKNALRGCQTEIARRRIASQMVTLIRQLSIVIENEGLVIGYLNED
jgi:hypothetical protein